MIHMMMMKIHKIISMAILGDEVSGELISGEIYFTY